MSLQDLELSPFLISELYKDALVILKTSDGIEEAPVQPKTKPQPEPTGYVPADTSSLGLPPVTQKPKAVTAETPIFQQPEPPKQETPTATIKHLGGNAKNITFIVNCPTDVFLPEKHLDWLGKMLEACKLNLGDIAIVNIAGNPITINEIKAGLQPNTIILLGTEPFSIQLPLNFPHFNPQSYADTMFLYTPAPDQMNQNTNEAKLLKSKLWVCLQKLFKL